MDPMAEDSVIACVDLVGRTGASDFQIGYVHDDVPVEKAGWYATAFFLGARITVEDQTHPVLAAEGLALRLLSGAMCRCTKRVALADGQAGCRWQRVGKRWEPGCDAAPLAMPGSARGDHAAMNRALRRRMARGGR